MMDNKKKIASLIVASKFKKPPPEEADDAEKGADGKTTAAEDILAAIASKSPSDLADALGSFFSLCESEPDSEDGAAA